MKRTFIALCAAVSLLVQGCAAVLIGTGAVAGYSLSKDSIEGYDDHSFDAVWNQAVITMKQRGKLTLQDKANGKFEGEVNGVTIKGEITRVTPKTVKMKISGRKALLPKVAVAQDIFLNITETLAKKK